MGFVSVIVFFLRAVFRGRAAIAAENLALRQQLAVLQVSMKRPRLRKRDRVFWVWLSRLWAEWRSYLMIVKPDTDVLSASSGDSKIAWYENLSPCGFDSDCDGNVDLQDFAAFQVAFTGPR